MFFLALIVSIYLCVHIFYYVFDFLGTLGGDFYPLYCCQSPVYEDGVHHTEVDSEKSTSVIQRWSENVQRWRRAGLPFTSVKTCQTI